MGSDITLSILIRLMISIFIEYWYSYNSKAKAHSQLKRTSRKIPKVADKTLDAPNLLNDFCEYIKTKLKFLFIVSMSIRS